MIMLPPNKTLIISLLSLSESCIFVYLLICLSFTICLIPEVQEVSN